MNAGHALEKLPRRILVVRLGAMGDVIHTLPAVAQLRRALPEAEIGWMIEERWAELLVARNTPCSGPRTSQRPLVDSVHTVNTKAWRRSIFASQTRRELGTVLREVRGHAYDVAVDFQGAIKSAVLTRLSRAHVVFGIATPREAPARWLYHRSLPTNGSHVIDQNRSLATGCVESLGLSPETESPESKNDFPHDPAAEAAINSRIGTIGSKIALINPGAGWGAKQWPADRYGAVAREIATLGFVPILNFGPGEEDLAHAVENASGGAARPITCSIGELIALTRRASLFVGGDTGPLHLAAALAVPVVAIFGPTDPARNGPYGTRSVVLRSPASATSLSHTSAADPGLLEITTEEVITAIRQLVKEAHA